MNEHGAALPSTAQFLREVDGISHVVLGPVALLAVRPIANRIGVPTRRLAGFLAAFIAYGGLVLAYSQPGPDQNRACRLFAVATVGNATFLACVIGSFTRNDLTKPGIALHAATAASAVVVGARAVSALRSSQILGERQPE